MQARSLKFNHLGSVDMEINHERYGWIPYTAQPNDIEASCTEFYNKAMAGEFGEIAPYESPPLAEIEFNMRVIRNSLLVTSDWTQLPDVPQKIKDSWAVYRQALRDVPQQTGFPKNITWPIESKT